MDLTAIIAQAPTCLTTCALSALDQAQCQLSDVRNCLCTNNPLQGQISICVQRACNNTEQIIAANLLQEICKGVPQPSRSATIVTVAITLAAIALPVMILRLVSRLLIARKVGWDDWFSFFTAILLIPMTVFQIRNAAMGFGKHFYNIPPANIPRLRQFYYTSQILYIVIQTCAKVSLLLLYLRIFPDDRFRRITKIITVLISCHAIGFLVSTALQCIPVKSIWDLNVPGKCINLLAVIYAGAGASIIEDFVLILLPISQLKVLQMSMKKKLALAFIFALGSFACITSLVRLKFLIDFGNSLDVTWDNTDIVIWSLLELYSALICGCLITIRPLLSTYLFKSLSSIATPSASEQRSTKISRPKPKLTSFKPKISLMLSNAQSTVVREEEDERELVKMSTREGEGMKTQWISDAESGSVGVGGVGDERSTSFWRDMRKVKF